MRGNEGHRYGFRVRAVNGLLIPMRGNEVIGTIMTPTAFQTVTDPHEG